MPSSYTCGMNAVARGVVIPSSGPQAGQPTTIADVRLKSDLTTGTLADQVDGRADLLLTFVASTPQTIALNTLVDIYGAALTVARVRYLAFKILATTDGFNLLVGGAASNEWVGFLPAGSKMTVFPSSAKNDGFTIISAPGTTAMQVTGGSFNLKLDPGANAFQARLIIGTCSA